MQIFFQMLFFQVLIIQSQLPSFHRALNKQLQHQFLRNETKIRRKTIDQLTYYQMYRRYLRDPSLNKFLTSRNLSSQNNSVVFVKATARSIAFYPCLKNRNQRLIKENIIVHF